MQRYQFEKIYSQMEKEFGKIKPGQEDSHTPMLLAMETNILKIHRCCPSANSRRLKEAIALVLFYVKGRCSGESFDTDSFHSIDNGRLERALLMAFDPFTNPEIMETLAIHGSIDFSVPANLWSFYQEAVMCLLKINDSVDLWMKKNGSDGYFDFLEEFIGKQVSGYEMKFSVVTGKRKKEK